MKTTIDLRSEENEDGNSIDIESFSNGDVCVAFTERVRGKLGSRLDQSTIVLNQSELDLLIAALIAMRGRTAP